MSNEAINWAFAQPIKASPKFVLVAMANLADANNICWPSCKYLADATGQDIKTVRASLRKLCESGHIFKTEGRRGVTGQVAVYQLNTTKSGGLIEDVKPTKNGAIEQVKDYQKRMSSLPETDALEQKQSLPNLDVKPTKNGCKAYQKRIESLPKTGTRTLNNPKTPKEPVLSVSDNFQDLLQDVQPQVLQDWKTLRKQKKAPITRTAVEGICREADKAGMSVNDALATCCSRGWIGFNAEWVRGKTSAQTGNSILGKTGQATAANALRWLEKVEQKEATDASI